MKQLTINPNNRRFYSEDFIKGFECGTQRQLEVDKADIPTWTPCSEKLPEESEWIGTKKFGTTISDEVLVTFESQGKRFVKPMHFLNGELGGMDKHTMDAFYGEWKAVAWMPLPAPWKGADDETD